MKGALECPPVIHLLFERGQRTSDVQRLVASNNQKLTTHNNRLTIRGYNVT